MCVKQSVIFDQRTRAFSFLTLEGGEWSVTLYNHLLFYKSLHGK